MRPFRPIDDEFLFRALTGSATEWERDQVAAWRRLSPANEQRYRDLETVLSVLAEGERAIEVAPAPPAEALLARARSRGGAGVETARRRRGPGLVSLAAVATTFVLLTLATLEYRARTGRGAEFGGEEWAAGATNRQVVLKDSTRVELGRNSHLRTALTGNTREVWLEGRAEFTVAPQRGLRFVVHTAAGDATDLGTRFVVRVEESLLQLVVFEGRVAVSTPGGSAAGGPGEMITAANGLGPRVVQVGHGHSASDWIEAALAFEGTPLNEVAISLQARYGIRMKVPSDLARRTVTAWFMREPTASQAVTIICRAVAARCTRDSVTGHWSFSKGAL